MSDFVPFVMEIKDIIKINGAECVLTTDGRLFAIVAYRTDGDYLTELVVSREIKVSFEESHISNI